MRNQLLIVHIVKVIEIKPKSFSQKFLNSIFSDFYLREMP